MPQGRSGAGLTTATAFSVPPESLGWWQRHLTDRQADADKPVDRDGEEVLTLRDPDGLVIDGGHTIDPQTLPALAEFVQNRPG